ncbi:MAG: dienelactone hydrolase family protein [Chloroflexi bacterium]|nr:dienelactone hydrolase family protein [Chloroflexota bacterium]
MKWIKRIAATLAVLLLLFILVIGGVMLFDVLAGSQTADFSNIAYSGADDTKLLGYLAQPPGEGPFPAVLMLHEWWGLNDGITQLADALAAEGYVVLVPDAYRGNLAEQVPGALFLRLTTPTEEIHADLDAGLAYLRALPGVDPARVAALGFCFGGEQSLQISLRQPENLAATIVLYGSLETDPAALQPIASQPLLGIFGAEDAQIPLSEVDAFAAALDSLGAPANITVYQGVGHAFVTEDNYNQPGAAGDAWRQMKQFLAQNLGGA